VRNLAALLEAQRQSIVGYLAGALVACIGPITARAAGEEGLHADVVAPEHTVDGLLAAILTHLPAEQGNVKA
jgi:uroporphyrinogen III methyltransferase/synthase